MGVSDGDTITVLDQAKQQHRVRLAGIDAPEKGQPFGQRSKDNLSALVYGKEVEARCHKRDRYGRKVCAVFVGSRDVGLDQVRAGMAWWYREYAREQTSEDRSAYQDAEGAARVTQKGLWHDTQSRPPWEWRKAR